MEWQPVDVGSYQALVADSVGSAVSTGSTVSIEGAKFTGNAIDQHDGNAALVFEGITFENQALSTATTISTKKNIENKKSVL